MNNSSAEVLAPSWESPPLDAWRIYPLRVSILFLCYIGFFVLGECFNILCLLAIRKTDLHPTTRYMRIETFILPQVYIFRYLMSLQCIANISYITVNYTYKAVLIYTQKQVFPPMIRVFCGSLHVGAVFTSMFLQVSLYRTVPCNIPPEWQWQFKK